MTSWRDSITVHPLADSFPMMSDGELKELAEDIRQNGQREPAVFVEIDGVQTLIDGRHRLEACAMIGREAWTTAATKLKDDAAIRAFIISHNVHRRHLTPEERQKRLEAAIVADPTASARAIGEKVGVDKNKVVKARKKLESTKCSFTSEEDCRQGRQGAYHDTQAEEADRAAGCARCRHQWGSGRAPRNRRRAAQSRERGSRGRR